MFKGKKNGNFNEMQKAVFSLFIEQIQFDFCSFLLHYVTAKMPLWIPDFASAAINYGDIWLGWITEALFLGLGLCC